MQILFDLWAWPFALVVIGLWFIWTSDRVWAKSHFNGLEYAVPGFILFAVGFLWAVLIVLYLLISQALKAVA